LASQHTDIDSVADYYIHQGGGGSEYQADLFGPVYVGSPYLQRGHGIGSFLAGLLRAMKPLALRGARAFCSEALKTGSQILADIGNKQPDRKVKEIVADRLSNSAHRLVAKLEGGGRKRKRETSILPIRNKKRKEGTNKSPSNKRRKNSINRDIFSF
jgi:hypothetical protein